MYFVAVENFHAPVSQTIPSGAEIWLKNSFEKKFQSPGYPAVLFMETKLAESIPSLRNLTAIPGIKGLVAEGAAAEDNLTSP